MSTTNLFVELVVIGVGAATWVILLIFAAFGWEWVSLDQALSVYALIPLVSTIYILGIVSDRLADTLFEMWWTRGLRGAHFADARAYHHARRVVLVYSERLADLLEYGRSRLRICRGWTLNASLIAVALNVFVWVRIPQSPIALRLSVVGTLSLILLAALSWFAWWTITKTEYKKVAEQAKFLESIESERRGRPA